MHEHHQHDHAHGHLDFAAPEAAAFAEVEGEALSALTAAAIDAVAAQSAQLGLDVRRVIDVGCGPGVGSCLLAERFPTADVVAADGSSAMLERAAARAARLGVAGRVSTRQVELPHGLDALGAADVVFASMVIHHVGDEADALAGIRRLLPAGGLLGLVEHGGPARVLRDAVELGRPGIWQRLEAAWGRWFSAMRAALPDSAASGDDAAMLTAARFDVLVDDVVTLAEAAPLSEAGRRLAVDQLDRTIRQLAAEADPADLDALRGLADPDAPDGIARRPDAILHATRRLYIGRATG
jgi:SAM-dependent methyltransferase